jgi:hypothetical protein
MRTKSAGRPPIEADAHDDDGAGDLAGVQAATGDAEAKLTLAQARRLNPQFTIKWFSEP